ncbi:tyrosine-type recombinase/integrase [Paenactinomyces guangxiensis]|uniref:Tyrosine-type recombinase/integrase n=1 Tax=Paenactinomyces guangxiensis TaxID=1490290 RepID=A0A7W2AAN0_9BACL|nr:tyrosine-type recombinase/integrase [Paenactinomyces guangxiensis]MBA4496369.1 tyrosine-type recombinase/integrase [Paenactinomyces guangxiensis]MBH8593518.1 tyrosine-type recombinase/integrase [Paenactinomyces guangxiensis]
MKHNLYEQVGVDEFQHYLEINGKSKNTISVYLLAIKKYMDWFFERYNKLPQQLFTENIADYKDYMNQQKMSASTFNARMAGLRSWNEFLITKGIQKEIVIHKSDKKKVQKAYASPAVHTEQEIQQFIQVVLEGGSKRDYALVNLLAYTGLRVSEALNLTMDDMHLDARELIVKEGKGNKSRTVFLSDRVVRVIREYLKQERHQYRLSEVSPFLFLSNRNRRLSRITVFKSFANYSKEAEIHHAITPHDLRHFFCSNALEKGLNVHEVAAIAGHSNIHTTLLYTNPSRKTILEKLNQL